MNSLGSWLSHLVRIDCYSGWPFAVCASRSTVGSGSASHGERSQSDLSPGYANVMQTVLLVSYVIGDVLVFVISGDLTYLNAESYVEKAQNIHNSYKACDRD